MVSLYPMIIIHIYIMLFPSQIVQGHRVMRLGRRLHVKAAPIRPPVLQACQRDPILVCVLVYETHVYTSIANIHV